MNKAGGHGCRTAACMLADRTNVTAAI